MGNCEDHPSERIIDSLQTAPLIAVLKKESSVPENSLVGYPKVGIIFVKYIHLILRCEQSRQSLTFKEWCKAL